VDNLDEIKENPAVLKIYGQYVHGLKKAGNLYTGSCPLHQDSHPSFSVYPDMRWTCFSGADCGSGNIFQLIERVDKISFQEAVEKVKIEIGQPDSWKKDKERVESVFKPVSEKKVYKTIQLSRIASLEEALKNSPEAIHYLDTRGITLETAQQLRLGFVQNLGSLAGEEGKDIADKGWLAFNYLDGDLVRLIKYRSLVRKRPGGFARQFGMETVLYGIEDIDPFEPIYLVSGEFDRAVMKQAGFRAVSLASDTHKPTPEQKDQLMTASMIILAGDTDTVGSQTMDRLWKEFGNHSYKLTWPDGSKDANDVFLNACGRDLSKFKNLVDELTSKAKSQPMPSVYSLQETMRSGDDAVLSDHPDRMRAPWHDVDTMVNIMPGDVVGINATNSGMGKSTFVLQWTLYNARKYGRSFVNFQAEMRPAEIATMVTAQVLRKDRNFLTGSDKKQAANELEGVEYYVGFDPVLNGINAVLDLLEAAIKRLSPYGVVLDHFHHLTTGMNNETQVQTAAMTRIKQIAETYKVVFFNVGQPRKATQQTKGKQIHLTDAKGSGAWADASNSVVTIHRELNKADDPTMTKGVYEDRTLVKLLKGRSMGTGNSACYLTSFGEFASFEQIDTNHESYEE
jgi:hypothetical protein